MTRAAEAQDSGDHQQIVANLEPLARTAPRGVEVGKGRITAFGHLQEDVAGKNALEAEAAKNRMPGLDWND